MLKRLSAVLALAGTMLAASISMAATVSAEKAWEYLVEGNKGFAKYGDVTNLKNNSTTTRRATVAAGQSPFAIVLTCSDSRVPPEILFDQGLGQVFVVRVAGNIVAPHELGSIEYGIEHLGANLVVVLGHERCGAVKSTYDAYPVIPEGNIGSLVEYINPSVSKVLNGAAKPVDPVIQASQVEECIVENIKHVREDIETKSPVVKEYLEGKIEPAESKFAGEYRKIKIIKAKYDLDSGFVNVVY